MRRRWDCDCVRVSSDLREKTAINNRKDTLNTSHSVLCFKLLLNKKRRRFTENTSLLYTNTARFVV